MRTINRIWTWAAGAGLGLALLQLPVARAADAPAQGGAAVQKFAHGEINWADGVITASGNGAPDAKAANIAVARLGAERAAKLDAFRNILEVLKGANVNAKGTVGDEMSSNGSIRAKVEGVVRNFKVVDTKYYSDGSVEVVVRMDMKGELADAVIPEPEKHVAVPDKGAAKFSGVIINAKGLQAVPAMSPRVLDEEGKEVYGAAVVTDAAARENGIAGYVKDLDTAQGHSRVKGAPLVVRAIKLGPGGKTDLVISNADAEKLRDQQSNLSCLAQGKVIIVVD